MTYTRRRFLALTGGAATVGFAGCSGDQTEVAFPPGYAADSIDLERALGPDSAPATATSVTVSEDRRVDSDYDRIERKYSIQRKANREKAHMYLEGTYANDVATAVYLADGTVYGKLQRGDSEASYFLHEEEFDTPLAYHLTVFRPMIAAIDFRLDEEPAPGEKLSYRARTAGVDDQAIFYEFVPAGALFGHIIGADAHYHVDRNGYPSTVEFEGAFGTILNHAVEAKSIIRYRAFNETEIIPPDWIDDAIAAAEGEDSPGGVPTAGSEQEWS